LHEHSDEIYYDTKTRTLLPERNEGAKRCTYVFGSIFILQFIKQGHSMQTQRTRAACRFLIAACLGCSAILPFHPPTVLAADIPGIPPLPPLDPQQVQDQDDMTWNDYRPIPGVDWADPSHKPERVIKVALVAADFDDQPFVMTLPKGSDLFKNPQIDPVKRADIAKFYTEFWNGRSPLHHGHTVNEYWMEQSHGKIGVSFDAFGPYHMPKKLFQYGLREFGQNRSGPEGVAIDGNLSQDCDALWRMDAGDDIRSKYQLVLRIFAGYDETCLWQEFGEMKFQTKEDIPAEFGNPDPTKPRWAPTRYVPWTSWKAAEMPWSNSSIINGESSGSIVHEVSHAAFSIGDNNNNPFVEPYRRAGSGPWDIMDRGSFGGPGGVHNRWQVPVVLGGAMPAGLMLRQKVAFKFVAPSNVVTVNREGLAKSGMVVAKIMARSANPGENGLAGIVVNLDGAELPIAPAAIASVGGGRGRGRGAATQDGDETPAAGRGNEAANAAAATGAAAGAATGPTTATARGGRAGRGGRGGGPATVTRDRTPWEDPATHPLSQGIPDFDNYTIEVVQRMGYDSFCPDSGVLIAKNKDRASSNGGPNAFNVFNWVIDAHPEDIQKVDFKRPNGEVVMRTIADFRQLNDALFHAGLNSGSAYEWEDSANRLHFYVVDVEKDGQGVLSYTIGVKSLDGAGPQERGVRVTAPPQVVTVAAAHTPCAFVLSNTGKAAAVDGSAHPTEMAAHVGADVYRLSVSVDGAGWSAGVKNALAAVKFGETQNVPVYVSHGAGSAGTATVVLTARSESDPSKTMTARCEVTAR
jgi:M6 family metalloprotease-like protein